MKSPENATDIKVGHKTPDEIKKGLETCSADECHGQHTDCPYHPDLMCIRNICADALALIQQLQAENAEKDERIQQLEAERDAAVEDMKQAAIYLCCACKKYHHAVRGVSQHYCEVTGEREDFSGAISCGMFEWRGVQKEE